MSVDALCETASVRLSARSGGDAVLVEQPAERVGPLDTIRAFEPPRNQVGAVEVAFSADEHPVQALGPGSD
jgi:hypothetical protein